ncbi:MAG: class I SAM-dependent methyltransferase [Anaerolineae bacterium]
MLLALAALAFYWLLVATEGTYLGSEAVTWLYDIAAWRYDRAKGLTFVDEARCIGIPLAEALNDVDAPRVLDVATGTGRVPLALMRTGDFAGVVYALDRSREMLAEGRKVAGEELAGVPMVRGDARALPYEDRIFDAVVCLEALEFLSEAETAIAEMVRVLKPGGVLLLSNRVGSDAWWFPGRMAGRGRLEDHLRKIGLEGVRMERWQVHYDLVWAYRPR